MFGTLDAAKKVSCRPLPAEGSVQTHGSPYGIFVRLSGSRTGFPTVLLFSTVSIIPPILYTQSFIYHQNYVTLTTDSIIKWHTEP
jgi:hypothetical protein